jgi:hypothetical protein
MRNKPDSHDKTPDVAEATAAYEDVRTQALPVLERLDLILDLASIALRNCAPDEVPDFTCVRRELSADASRSDGYVLSVLDLLVAFAIDANRGSLAEQASIFAILSDLLDHGIENCPAAFVRYCSLGCGDDAERADGRLGVVDRPAEEPLPANSFEHQFDRKPESEYGPDATYQQVSTGDVDDEHAGHDVDPDGGGMARLGAVQANPRLIPAARDQAGRTSDASNGA